MASIREKRAGMSGGMKTLLIVMGFFVLTVGATAVEIVLKAHQQRPLLGNVVALALLNINVLLLVVMLLLLGRQLAKFYFERKSSPFGAGFRSKLVASFVVLSLVPAGILFFVATGLLTGGVKYWFGPRVENTVRSSMALVDDYRKERQQEALRISGLIAGQTDRRQGRAQLERVAADSLKAYGVDLVEFYDADGTLLVSRGSGALDGRAVGRGFVGTALSKGSAAEAAFAGGVEAVIAATAFNGGDGRPDGLAVAGVALPESVTGKVADISRFYSEYWNLRMFKNPLKESYTLSFILFTLVVVFAALWLGLYLSRGITVPITSLAEATHRISRGEYDFKIDVQATDEVGVLVDSFRRMTRDLKESQKNLRELNSSLMESNALLEQRRQFIETVLENINTGVFTIDRAGRLSTVNRAAERITGLKSADIVGKGYREIFSFHQLDEIRDQIRAMAEGGRSSMEKDIQLTVNRRTLNLRLFITTLHDLEGGYLGMLIVFDDLTELIRAQRADAWKEVAKRIAHEVKNPLTPIQLSAQRLRKRYLEGGGDYEKIIGECTETIITQVDSMKQLVDEFSQFARMPEVKPAPCDLHGIIDEVVSLYQGAHKDVSISREYDSSMPPVDVDKEQMKRVFVNLFENAVAAMDGRGSVSVGTSYDPATGRARVEVADDGPGILPEDRGRLFQPTFSSKKAGMGLGLAIVNRIILDHNGHIRVEGNRPKGTRFIVELPAGA